MSGYVSEKQWNARHGLYVTPWTRADDHPDPARRMIYYTGIGHPSDMRGAPAPVFLAVTTLAKYATRGEAFPVNMSTGCTWAGDSGAYAALMLARDTACCERPARARAGYGGGSGGRPDDPVRVRLWSAG